MTVIAPRPTAPHNAFQEFKTGDPLTSVRCHCDDEKVTLTGCVTRFYHVQLAIEAARKLAEGRKIEIRIEVIKPAEHVRRADADDHQ